MKLTPERFAAKNPDRIMCGGCKATGVKLQWSADAVLVPVEPRQPCPTCSGTGYAPKETMTGKDFTAWLAFMVMKDIAKTDADAAALLGVHKNTLSRWKRDGAPPHVALACAAIDRRLPPWTTEHVF